MIGADMLMLSNATIPEPSTSGNFADDLSSPLALLLPRNWSPRAYLAALNEALTNGTLDRADWWNTFVYTYWSESPAALKVRLGGEAEYDIPTCMLGHFFACWQAAMGLTRLQLLLAGVNEGILPAGFPFLTASGGSVESLGLHGSLLIRQHVRGRLLFDPTGKLIQMELAIIAHDEYLLSVRAGALVAANFPPLNETALASPFICQWGFPASVHRLLDILTVLIRDVSNWLGTEDYASVQNHQNSVHGPTPIPPPGTPSHLQQMQQLQMQQLQWQQLANVQQLLLSPVMGATKKSHGGRVGSRGSPAGGKKKKRLVVPRPDLGMPGSVAVMAVAVPGGATPITIASSAVDTPMTGNIEA